MAKPPQSFCPFGSAAIRRRLHGDYRHNNRLSAFWTGPPQIRSSLSPNILTVGVTNTLLCSFSFVLIMVSIPFLTSADSRCLSFSFGCKIIPIAFHHNQTHSVSRISPLLILPSVFVWEYNRMKSGSGKRAYAIRFGLIASFNSFERFMEGRGLIRGGWEGVITGTIVISFM